MTNTLRHFWESLTSSLWFVPSIMTVLALCLAFLSIALDDVLEAEMRWAYGGGPDGARAVLAAIAGSMITVAGVAFSIMIVALTLASQQFGPRLLRNFMRDTGNQVVLGTFIATFTFCLIVLRTIRGGESEFVPHVSVTLAIVFALAGLGVLIYFIHHAAVSIQAPEVIALVANDLEQGIERLFPERLGHAPQDDQKSLSQDVVNEFETRGDTISAIESGYLQSIDDSKLMAVAQEKDLVLLLKCRPGDFVVCGGELVKCQPRGAADDDTAKAIQRAFIFGTQRTHLQDLEFSIEQLVEVAVRALSPGINDPFTAINCIDRLAAALCLLAQRSFPSPFRHDDHGKLRVIIRPVTFAGIVDTAFDSTRQYGRSSVAVTIRLLEAIATVARCVQWQAGREELLVQALMIERASSEAPLVDKDRADIEKRFKKALEALQSGSIPGSAVK